MTAPNLIAVTTINGKTSGVSLTTTATTVVLNNAPSSGKCLKINTLNVANISSTSTNITISWYTATGLGGTGFAIAGNISVPAGSTLNIVDKSSQYYLEENTSLGATASSANALVVTTSYEDIS
jgi:hypothetical protein